MTSTIGTQDAVRVWLLKYAWLGTDDERIREVDCIMAQQGWKHLSERVEQLMGQRSGENTLEEDLTQAEGIALSTLYECHEGPHLVTCPRDKD